MTAELDRPHGGRQIRPERSSSEWRPRMTAPDPDAPDPDMQRRIDELVANWPPLSPERMERVARLLRAAADHAAAAGGDRPR